MAKPSNCRARGYEIGTGGGNIRAPPMISSCNFFSSQMLIMAILLKKFSI